MVEQALGIITPIDRETETLCDFIVSHSVDRTELNDLGRLVASGLSLRVEFGLQISPAADQLIMEHVSKSLYYASEFKKLSIPDGVAFLDIDDPTGVPDNNVEDGTYVAAENIVNRKFPGGLVNYSPYYFEHAVVRAIKNGESLLAIGLLARLSSHEIAHLAQRRDSAAQYARDTAIVGKEGLIAWSKTQSERDAIVFEGKFEDAYLLALARNPLI
jgi:hypothetical protein